MVFLEGRGEPLIIILISIMNENDPTKKLILLPQNNCFSGLWEEARGLIRHFYSDKDCPQGFVFRLFSPPTTED
jgi:hypothetical protein